MIVPQARALTCRGVVPESQGSVAMEENGKGVGIGEHSRDIGGCVEGPYQPTSCLGVEL